VIRKIRLTGQGGEKEKEKAMAGGQREKSTWYDLPGREKRAWGNGKGRYGSDRSGSV